MSGGSKDYLSYKVESANFRENTVLRRAFRKHLEKIATALHEIEWADSGDTSPGNKNELAAIRACLTPESELRQAKEELAQAIQTADELVKIFGYDRTAPIDGPANNNEAA